MTQLFFSGTDSKLPFHFHCCLPRHWVAAFFGQPVWLATLHTLILEGQSLSLMTREEQCLVLRTLRL